MAGWCWYVWSLFKEAQGECVGEWFYVYYRYAVDYLDDVLSWYENGEDRGRIAGLSYVAYAREQWVHRLRCAFGSNVLTAESPKRKRGIVEQHIVALREERRRKYFIRGVAFAMASGICYGLYTGFLTLAQTQGVCGVSGLRVLVGRRTGGSRRVCSLPLRLPHWPAGINDFISGIWSRDCLREKSSAGRFLENREEQARSCHDALCGDWRSFCDYCVCCCFKLCYGVGQPWR